MFLKPFLNDSFIRKIQSSSIVLSEVTENDYCLISVGNSLITCLYFRSMSRVNCQFCKIAFHALSSDLLLRLLCYHKTLFRLISFSHALYIGKEIYKAELSHICLQFYSQS